MPLQFTWKKAVIATLALSLVFGGSYAAIPSPVYAATASAGLSTPFTDISKGHWAEKHIAKLALQGIITGYKQVNSDTYTFQPNKNVSQEEAVLMALRFAGLIDKVDEDADYGFADSFVVSSFFKPYVALAFKEGLLDSSEMTIAGKDPKIAWGKRPASREWVTKLIIKAIGKSEVADGLQNTDSSFSDGSQIDPIYKGYVNAAAQLELVKGVTETKFDPKANVTRASLATIFSRAQSQFIVDYDGQATGIATKLTESSVTVFSNGVETSYTLDENTLYYTYKNDSPISRTNLLVYGDVTVIAKDGKALYVEAKGDTAHTKTFAGTLGRIVSDEKKLYLWINNKPVEFAYDDTLSIEDTEGKPLKLSDLKADSSVSIVQDTFRDKPLVMKLITAAGSIVTSISGEYYGSDGDLITVKTDTLLVSKFLADQVSVEIDGLPGATIDDLLKQADRVELTLNDNDQVTKVKVVNRQINVIPNALVAGFLYDKKLLTVVDSQGNNAQALYFTDKTKIEYRGSAISLASASSMLSQNRRIMVTFTGNTIVSLQFVTDYKGTFVSLNSTSKTITVKLAGGTNLSLPYTASTIELPGAASSSFSELKEGDMLTLDLNSTQDKVATIKVHRDVQYEVQSVDKVNMRLRVKQATGTAFDLSVRDIKIYNESGAELTLDKITNGSIINASYVGATLSAAHVAKVTYGKVQSFNATSVTIADLSGKTAVFSSEEGFTVIKGASEAVSTSVLTVGDYVEIVKAGSNKTQITIAVAENRTFRSYDAAGGQIWVEQATSTDYGNYFYVTADTKFIANDFLIKPTDLKSGDTIKVYSLRKKALEVIKS